MVFLIVLCNFLVGGGFRMTYETYKNSLQVYCVHGSAATAHNIAI